MTISSKSFSRRRAAMAALLLLLATASGCGTLPTQPSLDSTADNASGTAALGSMSMGLDPKIISDGSDGSSGSGYGSEPPPPAADTTSFVSQRPALGPGNSPWGHSHKKPR